MILRKAKESDMDTINSIALEYDLDSNDTKAEQFIVAEENKKIVGFGRLLPHPDCLELGTIGVVEEYRGKGIARKIVNSLIESVDVGHARHQHIYLTTLIPSFFEQFGFKRINTAPPDCMIRKKEWCDGCKKVGCTVMKK
ncbi:MAG: GNAT family N-acetyltransferase [Candidatus Margulisiibacteriota bacterium]